MKIVFVEWRKERLKEREAEINYSVFVWIFWNGQLQTPLSILATFDHPVLLMFPEIPNIFVCVLLFSCLRAPRLSEQYPGIPIWIVQTEAYCSFTPLHCCRHCSYDRMTQKMCLLMSVSHSKGWTRFDKYKYSELLGLSQYQYKWKFTITIFFIMGTHCYFHYNWLDDAYTVCGDNTRVPKLIYIL